MPKWMAELTGKGGSVEDCITLWREMQAMEREERLAARDMKRAELENAARMRELELREKELAQQEAQGLAPTSESRGNTRFCKLPKFIEGQDPDVFLKSFEKLAKLHNWQKTEWPVRIVPLLSGKALETYARLDDASSDSYDRIKESILKRYELTAEVYRDKFRSAVQDRDESFREHRVRLERYLIHCCEREDIDGTYENLFDMILREQLLVGCQKGLRLWINEHKPKTSQELVELAESYQVAHKIEDNSLVNQKVKPNSNRFNQAKMSQNNSIKIKTEDTGKRTGSLVGGKQKTCYVCHKPGHLSYECPDQNDGKVSSKKGGIALCIEKSDMKKKIESNKFEQGKIVKLSGVAVDSKQDVVQSPDLDVVKGIVDGKEASVLRDTGSSSVFVHGNMVQDKDRTCKVRGICLADGTLRECEEVWIDIVTPYFTGNVLALVLDIPFAYLVIGNYVSTMVPKEANMDMKKTEDPYMETCQAVQTRSQKKTEEKIKIEINQQIEKLQKFLGEQTEVVKIFSKQDLMTAQKEDPALKKVRDQVQDYPSDQISYFITKDGILYRVYVPSSGMELQQIVLPHKYRKTILGLAHDIPLAGHLGIRKTRDRILQHHFWPGIFHDVEIYCKSCTVCQLNSSKGKSPRVPLVSIPPIDIPFRRIAIDFVGPLPLTEKKNRYILVIVDRATRYPEAVALRSQDAETDVDALMEIFSRVGFPEELLSDQGTNFMSSLMTEVCRMLSVIKKVASVYHPQTNGMCEKFNGVLKRMLKAYASLEPKMWDKYLIYVLFAYREVPNDTTGFSPFELLYGRNVRGPLSVIKEQWEEPDVFQNSVLSYLVETRERLKTMSNLAMKNEEQAKRIQTRYYDKKARARDIEVGSKVLVLLPTRGNKLKVERTIPGSRQSRTSGLQDKCQRSRENLPCEYAKTVA